jgi:hypothetical protein
MRNDGEPARSAEPLLCFVFFFPSFTNLVSLVCVFMYNSAISIGRALSSSSLSSSRRELEAARFLWVRFGLSFDGCGGWKGREGVKESYVVRVIDRSIGAGRQPQSKLIN